MASTDYVIAGGKKGRERLRVVARIFGPATSRLLDDIGIRDGMACLDAGSGGGDVSNELARRVGPNGFVLGVDLDTVTLEIARAEIADQNLRNVEFREMDVFSLQDESAFDLVYARFLLTHLSDPDAAIACMLRTLRPGGIIALEDVDFTGHFCSPECHAFFDYVRLYTELVQAKGGDPNIGPRLPHMLQAAGLRDVAMTVSQPADIHGETKLINPITMETIGEKVTASGLASKEEVARIIEDLYVAAHDDQTVLSTPRIVQVWARKS